MGVKDLIKKMEELGRNGAEAPGTSKTPASDLEAPVAASPQSTPVQSSPNDNGVSTSNEADRKDTRADRVSEREKAPPAEPAQPASTASTNPPENGAAVPEDPEKKAKKVCNLIQLPRLAIAHHEPRSPVTPLPSSNDLAWLFIFRHEISGKECSDMRYSTTALFAK